MKNSTKFLIIFNIIATLCIVGFLVYDNYAMDKEEAKGFGAGSSFTGDNYIQNLIGTKANPYNFATSSDTYPTGPQQPTTTAILALNNADDVNFQVFLDPHDASTTLSWYFEVCNAADCQVDGPWTHIATTTETGARAFSYTVWNIDTIQEDLYANPYVYQVQLLTPIATTTHLLNFRLTNLNASFLRATFFTGSPTDNSKLWVSVALK